RRIAQLDPCTVAWIDGPCLGGALELALACDYRAAAGGARTRLGWPHVRAGGGPCWGGTGRLPWQVGLAAALDLLLNGGKLSAAQALAAGLIDRAYGPRIAAIQFDAFVMDLQQSGFKPHQRRRLSDHLGRARQLERAQAELEERTSADHQAAYATLRAVAAGVQR